MLKILNIIFSVCLIFKSFSLKAEIQEIVMKWNALLCLNTCEPFLSQQLNNIPNLSSVRIDPRAGTAIMKWKPEYPFSYEPFNLATRTVGIRIADFRMKIRGTIRQVQDNFYIISAGDNTTFLLLGPVRVTPNRYIVEQNIASHPLSADIRLKLLKLATDQQMVIIEGPLFEPLRYLLMLVVEQLKLPKPDDPNSTVKEIEKYKLP